MTLNRHFALNSVLCRYVWSFEAWLQWMWWANFKPKGTAAASRGFLATARLSCSTTDTSLLIRSYFRLK